LKVVKSAMNMFLLLLFVLLITLASPGQFPVLCPSEGFCEVITEETPQTSAASPAEPEAKERESTEEPAPRGDAGYEYEEADVLEEELPLDEVQVEERLKGEKREKGTP
jgi:hypothetical protein